MLAGNENTAQVSSGHLGCTTESKSYGIRKGDRTYTFWDTCGFNEGEESKLLPMKKQIRVVGISLIIYCVRGRFTNIVGQNYERFCRELYQGKVPILLVVTGLEGEDKDEWWTQHKVYVKHLSFAGHACVTTSKGRNNLYEEEYVMSAAKVWQLVEENCKQTPWTVSPKCYEVVIDKVKKMFRPKRGRDQVRGMCPASFGIHKIHFKFSK